MRVLENKLGGKAAGSGGNNGMFHSQGFRVVAIRQVGGMLGRDNTFP
jgi:hypothetical protein